MNFGRLVAPYARRIANMLARGSVAMADSGRKMQTLQVRLLAGEVKDRVEHFEPFGFTSCPLPGAEHVSAFLGGDRSHGVVLVVADRRYRITGLQGGEAALHDAYGNHVHLKKDGTMAVVASTKVQITSPLVTMSGDLHVAGSITSDHDVTDSAATVPKTMAGMRGVFNQHTQADPQGGFVGTPTPQM